MEGSSSNRNVSERDIYLPNYEFGRTLGIGSFGKVKVAVHKLTGHRVAVKILNREKIRSLEMEDKVKREIKIMRLFMHPHIIRLYEFIESPNDIYLVMEYLNSGELFDYIIAKGKLPEDEARRFFQQIISGVEHCHRNMIAHRDLKPENLLLDSKRNIKIADFGLSNVMCDGHFLKTSCGSPNYAAPEVISGKLYSGQEVDMWSCGVILYTILCGNLPFDNENVQLLFQKIKDGIYTLPSYLSSGARDLISRFLMVDPLKRMAVPQVRKHPWFMAHLPRYLAVPSPDTAQQARKIDDDILQEVINMGFARHHLVESLYIRIQNDATVAYYLLVDNHFRIHNGSLGAAFVETIETETGYGQIIPEEVSAVSPHHSIFMDYQGMGLHPHFPVERKWGLGLQSRACSRDLMTEVLKAMKELNVRWKKIENYNVKCKWTPPVRSHGIYGNVINDNIPHIGDDCTTFEHDRSSTSPHLMKFEVQLFKERNKYLVDLQCLQGPQMMFLEFAASFLTQLRVV